MINYNEALSEKNTIACRNTGTEIEVHGDGHYEQKPYNPIIKNICSIDGVTLRTVQSIDTKFEILFDGVVMNRYKTLQIAENYFMDFTGITKAKFKKLALA